MLAATNTGSELSGLGMDKEALLTGHPVNDETITAHLGSGIPDGGH
jgi:hypothetical protein